MTAAICLQFGRYKNSRPMFSMKTKDGLVSGVLLAPEALWGLLKQVAVAAQTLPDEPGIPDGWEYMVGAG